MFFARRLRDKPPDDRLHQFPATVHFLYSIEEYNVYSVDIFTPPDEKRAADDQPLFDKFTSNIKWMTGFREGGRRTLSFWYSVCVRKGEGRLLAMAPRAHNPKGGMKMTGMAEVIVCLWFLPAALYVVFPLVMLCCWLVGRLAIPGKYRRDTAVERESEAIMPEMLARV